MTLVDGDFLDLYVQHVVDEVKIVKDKVPTGYLCGLTVGENVNEGGVENSHDINVGEVESLHDINVGKGLQQGAAQFENINVEVGIDDVSDLEGVETDLDISDNSQKFAIPEDDDSEIDEELRTLRNERRTKLQRKKSLSTKEITLGSAAGVDKEFEDIGRNKATRNDACKGKLLVAIGEDKHYINSSDLDSDDSRGELDPEVVDGVDLPARRRSKQVRFDPDCVVAIFELEDFNKLEEVGEEVGKKAREEEIRVASEEDEIDKFDISFTVKKTNGGNSLISTVAIAMRDLEKKEREMINKKGGRI
ncbi:hypothetical protein MTR67_001013 [Solanum verrucosum]|uniref:Uncharacterized protein n=1 Tax=Solanum verrucosum TaxID=315347 RepID=A0AAF0T811_SOLVR|nr:hypothetical protein MTR67_001013 [Solanum verrucosum]